MMKINPGLIYSLCLIAGCRYARQGDVISSVDTTAVEKKKDSILKSDTQNKTGILIIQPAKVADTLVKKDSLPEKLVAFAKSLAGVPYKFASSDPKVGFDCSGFISFVFNHFNIQVPRSSVDFTNYGKEITVAEARAGDLVLFTGTDSSIKIVGHMGIVVRNEINGIDFIHSTSGKANAVTISHLNEYYNGRFVKVIRVF